MRGTGKTLLIVTAQLLGIALAVVLVVVLLMLLAGWEIDIQRCGEVRDGVAKICHGPSV